MTDIATDPAGSGRPRSRRLLTAAGGLVALALIISFLVWLGTREDVVTSPTAPTDPVAPTTAAPATAPTTAPTTTAPTEPPVTTSTVPPTTEPPPTTTTVPGPPSGETWTVVPRGLPDSTLTVERVDGVDGATAYEGTLELGENALRCVVVAFADAWSELCTEPDRAVSFVALDGIDPWHVEVGSAGGDITLVRRAPTWTLPTNGCAAPLATMIPADTIGGAVLMSIRCVPGDAVMSVANAILGPGPPDGLIIVVAEGDEGWDVVDLGTEIGCESSDGVDRCTLYGVDEYLTGGFPVPPTAFSPTSADIVGVMDITADVRGWTGTESDPAVILELVSDEVVDPDDALEVPPTEYRVDIGGLTLVVLVIPQLDDSIRSVTYSAWVAPTGPQPIVLATSWATCARGIAGPDLCV